MDLNKTIDEIADELATILNQQTDNDWARTVETWSGRAVSTFRHRFEANKEVYITLEKDHRIVAYDEAKRLWVVRTGK